MAATTKSLESLTVLMEASSANSVSKLPSLDSFIDSSRQDHAHPSPSVDSAIRTAAFAVIQQPTIDQVRAAPNPEDAGRKGITDGGLVKVSNQASIIHFDNSNSGSKFQVLRTAGSADSASQVLAATVPKGHKFNPTSESERRDDSTRFRFAIDHSLGSKLSSFFNPSKKRESSPHGAPLSDCSSDRPLKQICHCSC